VGIIKTQAKLLFSLETHHNCENQPMNALSVSKPQIYHNQTHQGAGVGAAVPLAMGVGVAAASALLLLLLLLAALHAANKQHTPE
jgi:hypothetical protein